MPMLEETLRLMIRDLVREEIANYLRAQATPANTDGSGEWLTLSQAARLAGVHVATVRRWADAGYLQRGGVGRSVRVQRKALEALLASARDKPAEDSARAVAAGLVR